MTTSPDRAGRKKVWVEVPPEERTYPEHEHYWVDAYDDETGWHCTICGLTEYPGDPGIGEVPEPVPPEDDGTRNGDIIGGIGSGSGEL